MKFRVPGSFRILGFIEIEADTKVAAIRIAQEKPLAEWIEESSSHTILAKDVAVIDEPIDELVPDE